MPEVHQRNIYYYSFKRLVLCLILITLFSKFVDGYTSDQLCNGDASSVMKYDYERCYQQVGLDKPPNLAYAYEPIVHDVAKVCAHQEAYKNASICVAKLVKLNCFTSAQRYSGDTYLGKDDGVANVIEDMCQDVTGKDTKCIMDIQSEVDNCYDDRRQQWVDEHTKMSYEDLSPFCKGRAWFTVGCQKSASRKCGCVTSAWYGNPYINYTSGVKCPLYKDSVGYVWCDGNGNFINTASTNRDMPLWNYLIHLSAIVFVNSRLFKIE